MNERSKQQRLDAFFSRMSAAEAVASHSEAFGMIASILNDIEDEFSKTTEPEIISWISIETGVDGKGVWE